MIDSSEDATLEVFFLPDEQSSDIFFVGETILDVTIKTGVMDDLDYFNTVQVRIIYKLIDDGYVEMSEQCVGSDITFPDTGSEFNEYLIQVDPASETPASVVVIEWPEYITELT